MLCFIYLSIVAFITLSWHANYFNYFAFTNFSRLSPVDIIAQTSYYCVSNNLQCDDYIPCLHMWSKVTFPKHAYSFEASNNAECLLNSFIMVSMVPQKAKFSILVQNWFLRFKFFCIWKKKMCPCIALKVSAPRGLYLQFIGHSEWNDN